jgi:hypothetical protein
MRIRVQDGRVFEGTPTQIVQSMKSIALGAPQMTLGEYIDWVAARAGIIEGTPLQVGGTSEEERCERLVARMLELGLAHEA